MQDMRKIDTVILLLDLCLGLLFLGICESQNGKTSGRENVVRTVGAVRYETQGVSDRELENIKKIAITFDDGPHPTYTGQLLDGLKDRGVHATFFVTGEHAKLHPDIIKRMQEEGNLIGNHTYSHIQLTAKKVNRNCFGCRTWFSIASDIPVLPTS